jgi:hypothetical protein
MLYAPDRRSAQPSDQTNARELSIYPPFFFSIEIAPVSLNNNAWFVARCVQPCARVGVEITVTEIGVA